jgi:DNA-binding transcriptional MerR regulator
LGIKNITKGMHLFKINNISDFVELTKNQELMEKTLKSYAQQLHARSLHIKEVGISGKLLNDWVEAGVVNKVEVEGNKWRYFSLSEAIWIKFAAELRYFGVTLPQIKIIKENICEFNKELINELSVAIKAIPNPKENESLDYVKSKFSELQLIPEAQLKKDYESIGISFFDLIMIYTLIFDLEVGFCFTKSTGNFVDYSNKLGSVLGLNNLDAYQKAIGKESFAVINMKSIYKEFFSNDRIKQSEDFYFGIVTQKEKELLEYIRSGEYSSINIKVEEGIIKLIKVTKKDGDKLMQQIARLLKKGDFKEISFLSRDGSIVRYDEVDIIK